MEQKEGYINRKWFQPAKDIAHATPTPNISNSSQTHLYQLFLSIPMEE